MGKLAVFRRKRGRRRRPLARLAAMWCALLAGAWLVGQNVGPVVPVAAGVTGATGASARFAMCGTGARINCVVDGDTFYFEGEKIRIADIDTPETHPARCAREAELGEAATRRLRALLNAGPFTLERAGARDEDRYGRRLRVVVRGGESLGLVLVKEGLARRWTGSRRSWCD